MAAGFMDPHRRRTFIAYFLFGAIIVVFIFWGYKQTDSSYGGGYAATVNNDVISVGDFMRAYDRQREMYSQMLGKQFDMSPQRIIKLKQDILDHLISQELLVQGAETEGIWASDAEVRQQIFDIPDFQRSGRFSKEVYNGLLEANHLSPTQYEAGLRKQLVLRDLNDVFQTAARPTAAEIEKEMQSRATKANLEFIALDTNEAEQRIKTSDADTEKFLKSEGSEKKLEEFYNVHKGDYVKEGEVHARHILIKATAGDKASEEAALKKAQQVKERLKKEPFEKVAKEVSEDGGSKDKGGDLGYFGKGRMVPPFEDVAFSLEKGKVSDPVKSPFGYHLIEVLDKRGGKTTTLEQAKKEIAKRLVAKERATEWQNQIEKALALPNSPEKNAKINQLAAEANLKWESTGGFDAGSQYVPKLGSLENLTQQAFGLSKEKPYADKLFRQGSKAYVVRLKEFTTEKVESKSDETADQIARSRAQDALGTWEKALAEKAKIHKNLEIVTERQN